LKLNAIDLEKNWVCHMNRAYPITFWKYRHTTFHKNTYTLPQHCKFFESY
jgi:hypothetical protein